MKTALKVILWVILAVVLFIGAALICTVEVLHPQRLTPLAIEAANRSLKAEVYASRVEFKLRKSFPFLDLEIDSLIILSEQMLQLPAQQRDTLPAWADTLFMASNVRGGINLAHTLHGAIYLNDVVIKDIQANLLVVNESLNNFSITYSSDDDNTESSGSIPDMHIKSFRLSTPNNIRYCDLASGTSLTIKINEADMVSQKHSGDSLPAYKLDFSSNINSPLFDAFGLNNMPIAFDGCIDWRYKAPYQFAFRDFIFKISELNGKMNTDLDFSDVLTVKDFDFQLYPLNVTEALERVPLDTRKEYGIPADLRTNAEIAMAGKLLQPYQAGSADLPHLDLQLTLPPCYVNFGKVDIGNLELRAQMLLHGEHIDQSALNIERLLVEGQSVTLDLTASVKELLPDPMIQGEIKGRVTLDKLPPEIRQWLDYATTRGSLTLDTKFGFRPSWFSRNSFHKLQFDGTLDLKDIYYLTRDTLSLYQIHNAHASFGSNQVVEMTRKRRKEGTEPQTRKIDSLLTAKVQIDSSHIMVSGLLMNVSNLSLGVGALNKQASSDTTAIIPMGGKLKVGMFSLFTLSDTAGVRIRDLEGQVSMRRYHDDAHLPLFGLNASIRRISAGDNSTRFMVTESQLNTRIYKLPTSQLSARRQAVKAIADSVSKANPYLSPDSVYSLALEIRRRNAKGPRKSLLTKNPEEDYEIIDWGTSRHFKRFLLDWRLKGSLTAKRARLFTSAFPVRNRAQDINVKFNNDSIVLTDIKYKAGHSDFLISGLVSNMQRAFTSRGGRQSLKVNLDLVSDTIDVNELANAFFTGAANTSVTVKGDIDDEESLQRSLEEHAKDSETGPFLIPTNLNAEIGLHANHVLYSDFMLDDLTGTALAYDGALNLHQLKAASNVGSIDLSALYSAPTVKDMKFGFGMELNDFNIRHFLNMMPSLDSIMPLMRDLGGIINAKIAATSDVDPQMNLLLPTLHAAISLSGDSITFLDQETFKKISKWLLFRDKNKNMINHMSVNMLVENSMLQLYPFVFDFDRYRLGVQGENDLDLNYNYHIAVLKSPLPFKFGINVKGTPDKFKIRLGRAHFNEKLTASSVQLADTTRINLVTQLDNIFRRGVRNSRFAKMEISEKPTAASINLAEDTISHADSLYLIQQGLIPDERQIIP